ncbi:MAG TPA: branched-chain amino acid ABC transporter permease, partial [Myxococcales bacterium]|nr:branched-chain amino acid ABC transporter permease [Myxococcales bacterium]
MRRIRGALTAAALAALLALYCWAFLRAESQRALALLVLLGVAAGAIATRTRILDRLPRTSERAYQTYALLAVAALCIALREDDFELLLVARVLIVAIACLGLHIQLGYAGVLNFAGASFFGVGGYTAAVLSRSTPLPHLFILLVAGAMAALIGSLIVVPVLRTRGHYAALVTIAFALLFRTFLEVNDALGGPQGLKLREIRIGPWRFNDPVEV